jgi:hypothetical protein
MALAMISRGCGLSEVGCFVIVIFADADTPGVVSADIFLAGGSSEIAKSHGLGGVSPFRGGLTDARIKMAK